MASSHLVASVQKLLMMRLLRLKLDVPKSASTEEVRAIIDTTIKEVVEDLPVTEKNKKNHLLFDILADLRPVFWGLDENRRQCKWMVDDQIMPLWMPAFIGIVRD